ncbi:hypothetical protein [Bradyrhizobium sp. SZCCHNR1039]|uniref:hypothetical protein n=1 Tax=Bradyrhizobium sp. SZCCHNR1039 TaxID=3057350 RepID=UPI0029162C49|nr:hypothetical protein [Bradyrhizobium sp. SZCCHNR1039]
MIKVIGVERLSEDRFLISVGDENDTFQSVCRLAVAEVAGSQEVKIIEFESDEFQKMIMKGQIRVKDIAKAIAELE